MTVIELCKNNINLCVPWLLKSAFLYYIRDTDSSISDYEFDSICKLLLENWQSVDHRLKYLITEDDLRAGTLYSLSSYRYPEQLKRLALLWEKLGTKQYLREMNWSI